jgi:ketosteroid isomerase-like protein
MNAAGVAGASVFSAVTNKEPNMSVHTSISPEQIADRLAIRELVDAYAHCADRRDADGQMSLFTADTHFVVFMNSKDPKPSQELHSRKDLAPVFEQLKTYDATTHFNGQSTVVLEGERATGETYCLAHHVTVTDGKRRLMIASIRYLDVFTKREGEWLFAERKLFVDWIDERPIA